MLATDPFYEVLNRLIKRDRKLREAIADYQIRMTDEQIPDIRLIIRLNCLGIAQIRIFKIARTLLKLGNFSKIVLMHQNLEVAYSMASLISYCPEIVKPARLEESQVKQQSTDAIRFRSWLDKELESRSAFLISVEGVYLECHIRKGVTSKIDPEQMRGKILDDVIGISAGFNLLLAIKDAYEKNVTQEVEYTISFEDEVRRYQGEIIPFPGTGSVMVLCKHVTPQTEPRH